MTELNCQTTADEGHDEPHKKHRKHRHKHRSSGNDQLSEMPSGNVLESLNDSVSEEKKKHKRRHKSSESHVQESSYVEEPSDPVAKKKKKKHRKQNEEEEAVDDSQQKQGAKERVPYFDDSMLTSTEVDEAHKKKKKKRKKKQIDQPEINEVEAVIQEQGNNESAHELMQNESVDGKRKKKRKRQQYEEEELREAEPQINHALESEMAGKKKRKKKHKKHYEDDDQVEQSRDQNGSIKNSGEERKSRKRTLSKSQSALDVATGTPQIEETTDKVKEPEKKKAKINKQTIGEVRDNEDIIQASGSASTKGSKEAKPKKKASKSSGAKESLLEMQQKTVDMNEEEQQKLFVLMLDALPMSDSVTYSKRLRVFNWDLVKFGSFSADQCRKQWNEIGAKVRKSRTLAELVCEAQKKIFKSRSVLPKLISPVKLYLEEMYKKLKMEHPKMALDDLLIEATRRYDMLPIQEKKKYADRFKEEITRLRKAEEKIEVGEIKSPRCAAVQLFINKKVEEYLKQHPEAPRDEIAGKFRKKWTSLSDEGKVKYIRDAEDHNRKMKDLVKQICSEDPSIKMPKRFDVLTKEEERILNRFDGVPDKPPQHGYQLFFKLNLEAEREERPDASLRDIMGDLGHRWSSLSSDQKEHFNKLAEKEKGQYQEFLQKHPKIGARLSGRSSSPEKKKKAFEGQPRRPPSTGYMLFTKEVLSLLNDSDIEIRSRMQEVSRRWSALSDKEKAEYNGRMKSMKKKYEKDLMAFKKKLPSEDLQRFNELQNKQKTIIKWPHTPKSKSKVDAKSEKPKTTETHRSDETEAEGSHESEIQVAMTYGVKPKSSSKGGAKDSANDQTSGRSKAVKKTVKESKVKDSYNGSTPKKSKTSEKAAKEGAIEDCSDAQVEDSSDEAMSEIF